MKRKWAHWILFIFLFQWGGQAVWAAAVEHQARGMEEAGMWPDWLKQAQPWSNIPQQAVVSLRWPEAVVSTMLQAARPAVASGLLQAEAGHSATASATAARPQRSEEELNRAADRQLQRWEADHTGSEIYELLRSGKQPPSDRTYTAPEQPTVYLTFDDGPSALTPKVLDILREEGVKATFFQLGAQAERFPEIVRQTVQEGHRIGNHTYNHRYEQLYSRFDHFWDQIQKSEDVFADIAGVRPDIVRAPGGSFQQLDAFSHYYLQSAGYTVYDWNIDSGDSRRSGVPAAEIIANVEKSPLRHELNVLMHDGAGHEQTVQALPDIIRYFKNKGYTFAVLDSSVKPVQFTLKASKWNQQGVTEEAFVSMFRRMADSTHMQEQARQLVQTADGQGAASAPALTAEAAYAHQDEAMEVQPLRMKVSAHGEARELELKQRKLEGAGEALVPLRQLAEGLGGSVAWDSAERVASVRLNGVLAELAPDQGGLAVVSPDRGFVFQEEARLMLADGSLYVPLEAAMQWFGYHLRWAAVDEAAAGLENTIL
ncbi:polysaccharide deacetylase [Paenibacillus sp. y28]|uniref:polysaccharide deacetylase n=1 Tax=Paenibacillus sp. y28 TaxID=3129110 RepID=UPI00301A3E24